VAHSDFRGFWRALHRADLVVIGGGGLFQDLYNLYPVPFFTATTLLAKLLCRRVMFYALGIGPLHGKWTRWLTRLAAEAADLITTRDSESAVLLRELGVKREITITADSVFLLSPASSELAAHILGAAGCRDRRLCIGVSVHTLLPWRINRKRALAVALDRLVDEMGAQVVFIPFGCYDDRWARFRPSRPVDRIASEEMAALMAREATVLTGHYTPQELMAVIGQMDLMLSMRFHGLVMATVMGVPSIALTYRREVKLRNFMRRLGQENNVLEVETVSPDELLDRIRRLLVGQEQLRIDLRQRAERLRQQARQNVLLLAGLQANERAGNVGNQS
jgi:polysaccharide pyruvyl transferase CsaB